MYSSWTGPTGRRTGNLMSYVSYFTLVHNCKLKKQADHDSHWSMFIIFDLQSFALTGISVSLLLTLTYPRKSIDCFVCSICHCIACEQTPKKTASEASREGRRGKLKVREPADKGFMPPFQSTRSAPDFGATSDWSDY